MSIYWIWHSHIYMGLGTQKNSQHRLHIVSGSWKNSEFSPFIWALGLGKIPRPSFLLSSGTWKNFDLQGLRKILSSASIQALGFEKILGKQEEIGRRYVGNTHINEPPSAKHRAKRGTSRQQKCGTSNNSGPSHPSQGVGMKTEIFPSPRAQEEAQAWNFSKS